MVDHLHGDVNSLRACALTSSSWLAASRYHLFNDVFFKDEASVLRWTRTFITPSVIPQCVENIHFSCVSLLDDISSAALDLSTFTHLKGLFVDDSGATSPRLRRVDRNCLQRMTLLPSTTMRTFSLSCPVIPVPDVFLAIRHFSRLDNLALRCFTAIDWGDTKDAKTETSPSFGGALTLVSHIDYKPLIKNLLAFAGGIRFTHLDLAVLRHEELPDLRGLVDACSGTITSLSLTLDLGEWVPSKI